MDAVTQLQFSIWSQDRFYTNQSLVIAHGWIHLKDLTIIETDTLIFSPIVVGGFGGVQLQYN